MRLTIPGELVDLNTYINAERSNRYAGAKIKQEMTDYITLLAKRLKAEIRMPVRITYRWYCKNKRKDKSNIAFAKKFIEDGLVNAGVLKNDGWNDIEGFNDRFYIDKANPRVEVEITELAPEVFSEWD
jgi:Holliday junction resolvase RusA-like endonuclease